MLPFHMHRFASYHTIIHDSHSEETIRQNLLLRRHSYHPQNTSAMGASSDTAQPTEATIERCVSNGIGGAGNLRKATMSSISAFGFTALTEG